MNQFKLSKFNVDLQVEDGTFIIFNTASQGLLEVDAEDFSHYRNLTTPSQEFTSKFLEYNFWVERDFDEIKDLIVKHRVAKFSNEYVNVTIKTTNDCNFLCKYCYQDHQPSSMDEFSITKIKRFFDKLINQEKHKSICIHWFGGEPLLNLEPIIEIEKYVAPQVESLKTSLTTNGYLLTQDIITTISETKIRSIQITLDGVKHQHDNTRQLRSGEGTFERIVTNIKNCLEIIPDMILILRVNVNKGNDNVEDFLRFILDNGLKKSNIRLLFNEAKRHSIKYTDEDIFYTSLEEYAVHLKKIYETLAKFKFSVPMYTTKWLNCEFDNINNYLIDVDAKIYQCTSAGPESQFYLGEICEDGRVSVCKENQIEKILREPFNKPKCLNCKVLPMCMGGCNYLEKTGLEEECIPEKYFLDDLVRLYYESRK